MSNITLVFTPQEMSVLNEALMLVSYGKAAPVVQSINTQIQTLFDAKKDSEDSSS